MIAPTQEEERHDRRVALILAAVAALFISPAAVADAEAQHKLIRVALDQTLLDRWLVAFPAVLKLGKSGAHMQTDDQVRPHMERICADAGFDSTDQGAEVIGYVGMIVSACDPRTRSFRDPIVLMRRERARLDADTRMPPAEREQKINALRRLLAVLPKRIPDEHRRLMTANRDRIFKVILPAAEQLGLRPSPPPRDQRADPGLQHRSPAK